MPVARGRDHGRETRVQVCAGPAQRGEQSVLVFLCESLGSGGRALKGCREGYRFPGGTTDGELDRADVRHQPELPLAPGISEGDTRGDRRVSAEVDLGFGGEVPNPDRTAGCSITSGQEGRLAVAHVRRDLLHPSVVESFSTQNDTGGVATVRRCTERRVPLHPDRWIPHDARLATSSGLELRAENPSAAGAVDGARSGH